MQWLIWMIDSEQFFYQKHYITRSKRLDLWVKVHVFLGVFGINTASDIWGVLKYQYEPVIFFQIFSYLLFIPRGREVSPFCNAVYLVTRGRVIGFTTSYYRDVIKHVIPPEVTHMIFFFDVRVLNMNLIVHLSLAITILLVEHWRLGLQNVRLSCTLWTLSSVITLTFTTTAENFRVDDIDLCLTVSQQARRRN